MRKWSLVSIVNRKTFGSTVNALFQIKEKWDMKKSEEIPENMVQPTKFEQPFKWQMRHAFTKQEAGGLRRIEFVTVPHEVKNTRRLLQRTHPVPVLVVLIAGTVRKQRKLQRVEMKWNRLALDRT